jgi:hypothetical protein
VLDDGGQRHRPPGLDVRGDLTQLREGLLRDLLHIDVEDAAAGEPDGERVVVGDAVPLQHRLPGLDHRLRQLVDRAFHAATGHRTHRSLVGPDEHRRTGRARCGLERRDHGADADGVAGLPPLHELGQHVTHGRPPTLRAFLA